MQKNIASQGLDLGYGEKRLPLIIESLKFCTQMKTGKNLSFKNEQKIILNIVFDQRSFIGPQRSRIHFIKFKSHY